MIRVLALLLMISSWLILKSNKLSLLTHAHFSLRGKTMPIVLTYNSDLTTGVTQPSARYQLVHFSIRIKGNK